jgi:acetyl esterase/lipase
VRGSRTILFSPSYRLAPEDPFPAGLEDVCAAYEWMHAHAAHYSGDATRTAIMGGSAGANLATGVALKYAGHAKLAAKALLVGAMASCHPDTLPQAYRASYTPERYVDAPLINAELIAIARGAWNVFTLARYPRCGFGIQTVVC